MAIPKSYCKIKTNLLCSSNLQILKSIMIQSVIFAHARIATYRRQINCNLFEFEKTHLNFDYFINEPISTCKMFFLFCLLYQQFQQIL